MLTPLALFDRLVGSFTLGVFTPLTAVCVLPLYPGFVAYLSRQDEGTSIALLGALIASGVLAFMSGVGLLFSTVLQTSLTRVIDVVSPLAFLALGLLGAALLLGVDPAKSLPAIDPPGSERPLLSAFGYGFFFGAIVIPCNPGFVAIFFARSFLFREPLGSLLNFLAFGLGIVAPLLALAFASERWRSRVIAALRSHGTLIDRATGALLLAASAYYLVAVFEVVPGR